MSTGRGKVLILGASGMLGNTVLRFAAERTRWSVTGSVRSASIFKYLPANLHGSILTGVNVEDTDSLIRAFEAVRPDLVINCIGLVKQLAAANNPLVALPINAMLPHRLACLSALCGARFVHVSSDCVFSGAKGNYEEKDFSDASDLYGRSKLLGEVDYPNAITLRTSIIGRQIGSTHALVEWFLSRQGSVRGFAKAIFSGLPTVELARVIFEHVVSHPERHGLYHVSADPISKLDLLRLIARTYGKEIDIVPDETVVIDRSLDSSRFRSVTGYHPPEWSQLVEFMRDFG